MAKINKDYVKLMAEKAKVAERKARKKADKSATIKEKLRQEEYKKIDGGQRR